MNKQLHLIKHDIMEKITVTLISFLLNLTILLHLQVIAIPLHLEYDIQLDKIIFLLNQSL
jgi:hypothetical protein